ncbi:hypothetical protein [Brevundimonas sp.]|uniref:DUF7668 domain-containing protein n=1 Tax=Brevundimonas sp. TaxID=1871086 RepID=UPI00391DCD8C
MLKKDDGEHPVPDELRHRFRALVSALVSEDFQLSTLAVEGVSPIDADTGGFIAGQVAAYGDGLAPLSDRVWQRSVYRWMDGYWEFVVDLSTVHEPVSDLALHAKLADHQNARLEVWSVHVP